MRVSKAIAIMAVSMATAAQAQTSCVSLDSGQFRLGETLSVEQRARLKTDAPSDTVHCSRDGQTCSVATQDGTVYGWRSNGVILRKAIALPDPTRLAGWAGQIDQKLATDLGKSVCTRFTVAKEELGDGYGLKSDPMKTASGQTFVTNIYGSGTDAKELTIEMNLVD